MEKNKKNITIALVALLISILSVGIAFAAMSSTLTINGSAAFNPADWNVKFKSGTLQTSTVGAGEITGSSPTLSATSISTYAVKLTKPGDAVRMTFIVENSGNLDAIIASLSKDAPVCTGTVGSSKAADEALVCNNLVYTLTNGTVGGGTVATGQALAKTTTQTMVLNIEYPISMTAVPEDDVTITIPTITIVYEQD